MSYIFVDFDRTLFNTPYFMDVMWHAIGSAYGVNAALALADVPNWYRYVTGAWRYYVIEEHIPHVTGQSAPEVMTAISATLARHTFVYPDTTEVLYWQRQGHKVHIVTFGEQWFQRVKLELVPILANTPCTIVLQEKAQVLRQQFPDVSGMLIDDKRNTTLPQGLTEVWLRRQLQQPIMRQNGMISVNSLKQVTHIL